MLNRLMEQLKNNKKSVFNHAAQIIILLVVIKYFYDMINPIIKVAQYSHPTMDDYWMTTYVHEQWLENHSVLGFIAAAFRYAIGIYKTWDGNFLSMFITSMSPAVYRRLCVFFHVLFYVRDILYRLTCRNVCHTLQKIPYAFNQLCEHGTAVYRIFYELSCQCGRRSVLVAGCRQLYLLFWYVYVRTQYVCTILGEP